MSIYLFSHVIVIFVLKKYIKVFIIIYLVKKLVFFINHQKTNFVLYKIFQFNNFDFFLIKKIFKNLYIELVL